VGFLGYKFMGKAHANALARLPMFFPEAPATDRRVLIGRDEAALADAADRFDFATTATDWEAAIEEIDVLYNLGPNHLHVEPSIAALERGVHVFTEKPLAPTVEGAERVAEAAAASDATAGIAFNFRFVPALRYARRLIADGALGEIRHVRARYLQDWLVDPEAPWSWRNSAELAGSGALGDLGAHSVDLLRYLVGDADGGGEIERVAGRLTTFVDERPVEGEDARGSSVGTAGGEGPETRPVTVDDAYTASIELAGGAVGTLEASRVATGRKNDHAVEIEGTKGSLRYDHERLNELAVRREGDRGYQTVLVTEGEDPYIDRWWPPGHIIGWEHTFVHENYEFLTALAEDGGDRDGDGGADGDAGFEPDIQDGLAVQRVLDAIERSDETDEWVRVE
jgi:predicted dehydrogenase